MRIPYLKYWLDTPFEIERITGPYSWFHSPSKLHECRLCGILTELPLVHQREMIGFERFVFKLMRWIDRRIVSINKLFHD